jgi:valyl-tRNA synthetase
VLETGYDILFFWVARMIMFGLEFTGQPPFHTVYLHGLIRDEHGQKMSKTKGNAIDPLDVMNEMGTDALRFSLLVGSSPGNDLSLSLKKVEANRNFANKVWNAGRFILSALDQAPAAPQGDPDWTLADSWIWARLQGLLGDIERLFTSYQYGEAGRQIYEFFWSEFADWYIEIAKLQMTDGGDRAFYTAQTLVRVLDTCLRLLHPFTPFVTEELWGHLKRAVLDKGERFLPGGDWPEALMIARWPEARPAEGWEEGKIAEFILIQEAVRAIRNLRTEKKVTPGKRIPATIVAGERLGIFQQQAKALCAMAYIDPQGLTLVSELKGKPQDQVALTVSGVEIYLPLAGLVDVEAERARLRGELAEIEAQIHRLEALLAGPFGQKAPAAVVDKERQKLLTYQETAARLREQLDLIK